MAKDADTEEELAQEYRFEKVVSEETMRTQVQSEPETSEDPEGDSEETIRTEILQFLDAEGAAEKLNIRENSVY